MLFERFQGSLQQGVIIPLTQHVPWQNDLLNLFFVVLGVHTFGPDNSNPTRPMSFPNYSDPLVANWSSGRDSITLTPTIFDSAMLGTYGPFEVKSNCTVGPYWGTNFDSLCRATFEVVWETGSRWLSKYIVRLFWGTHFQHGDKFVPQNSPRMHFDSHLNPVSRKTSKWRIANAKRLQRFLNCLINSAISSNTNPCKELWMDNEVFSF